MSDKQGAPTLPPLGGGGGNDGGSNGGAPQQTVSLQQVFTAQGFNILTAAGGQQYFLTSQVPGLAQVVPSQQLGVTRIVNISGASPRLVAGGSGTTLSSPSRQNPTKVVLTTSPKLVRTSISNMFVAPTAQAALQSVPARKRSRLSESTDKITSIDDFVGYRRRILDHKIKRMRAIREKYAENASELFFLHNGGNMMDYHLWKKRPQAAQFAHFMRQHRLDPDDEDEDLTVLQPPNTDIVPTTTNSVSPISVPNQNAEVSTAGTTSVAVTTAFSPAVAQLTQQGGTPIVLDQSRLVTASPVANVVVDDKSSTAASVDKVTSTSLASSPQPIVKLVKLPSTSVSSPTGDMTSNSQEQIVEKAKQEAYVMQRIAELQREGLWSERRLPKVQEPGRSKAHWDYLLEEMVWLAADFAQERKWKKAAAKKCARMVQKYFQEKAIQAQKAEKLEELRLKKLAGFVAKEIKTFWANVEKLVEYKQQTRLEEKRKKALDQHLNFIVGQTEKYSSWLTEGLNKNEGNSIPASINSSRISSPVPFGKQLSDDEFEPNQSSDDDEETIAKAEEEMKSNHKEEVELLKKESEIPLEDLLKELPSNYLEERHKSLSPESKETIEDENERTGDGDMDFMVATDESSEDDEDTIMEQEKKEKNQDHKQELDDLKCENEMSIEELRAKYSGPLPDFQSDAEDETDDESVKDTEPEDEDNDTNMASSSESENEDDDDDDDDDSQNQSDNDAGVGLKSLFEDMSSEKAEDINMDANHSHGHNEMDDVAALAESIQPKGNTLQTTSVVTKIPFLLKHSLREYQHIGLDWLVTMFERKLNGILADEMGLGKTIQTIALLAHLACEKGNWGPHLIIVPTSVMLNWEMECKKWCPGFKILTYYGSQKERKQKRIGWTKPNAFHICITSYKLVIQDHQSFRRKKWKYLILDEAQNIKNFKSQRWQLLLNFQTQRRLLLTGTPLQNNLMELWSLMHFLMPNVFQSHREFKEWFSNPVTGMIEGNSEYNENIIRRLHKVLRPFLLRRLKTEVEKQLPKKYEHVVMCRLSKRQRYLYDDFMSRAKTKETLASGNLLSVINVLMQLRKVCNHPNLFEVRPTVSPFQMEGIDFATASLAWSALDYDPFKHIDLTCLNLLLVELECTMTALVSHRVRRLQTPKKLIEEIDNQPEPPVRCPPGRIKINVRLSNQVKTLQPIQSQKMKSCAGILPTPRVGTSPFMKNNQNSPGQGVTLRVAGGQQLQGLSVQLVQHQGSVKAIPVGTIAQNLQTTTTVTPTTAGVNAQRINTVTVKQGDSVQRIQVPSFAQLVQTSTGRHIILTSNQQNNNAVFPVVTSCGQRLTVLSKNIVGLTTQASVNKVVSGIVTTTAGGPSARPVMRVPPLNVNASQAQAVAGQTTQSPLRTSTPVKVTQKDSEKGHTTDMPKSDFHIPHLEETRRQRRQSKLEMLSNVNERRCAACPLYGEDLFLALRLGKPATSCRWHNGWLHCSSTTENLRTRRQFFSRTEALAEAIKSTERIVEELKEIFDKFVVYVPAVQAPIPRLHVYHPPPHKLWANRRMELELKHNLAPKLALLHPVANRMVTQFPEPRLIQYDCGKLQALDRLLRQLKSGSHRVLIFTQMTRMLDVLEAFLNFHGHIYLRLDGATRVDQRQVLMERFNGDKRIFCFILSTRSGGVGVNLTGADTVIFYDSDWNPTMDAQAQDRCHRIGQTRDVHIYRLVSDKTVEENILKKANQKRLLGDLAIEGGNFTTAYFKSSTIQELFNIDQNESDASTRMAQVLESNKEREKALQRETAAPNALPAPPAEDKVAIGALESALAAVEEDLDVQAAKTAKAEAVADLAEFDENIPLDEAEKEDTQISKAELEIQVLVSQLSKIERYAMKYVEESDGCFSTAQLAAAERELEEQKKEWELDRLRALRDEEERQMRLADDDEKPLTFGREDAQNQVNNSNNSRKVRKPPQRRSLRRNSNRSAREQSESEIDTGTDSEIESQDDLAEDSPDERSSHDESQSVEEEEEDGEEEEDDDPEDMNDESGGKRLMRNRRRVGTPDKNYFDINSPRTRSRGNVKINLWTLDVSPILPQSRGKGSRSRHRGSKGEEGFILPLPPDHSLKREDSSKQSESTFSESMDCDNTDDTDRADGTLDMMTSDDEESNTKDCMQHDDKEILAEGKVLENLPKETEEKNSGTVAKLKIKVSQEDSGTESTSTPIYATRSTRLADKKSPRVPCKEDAENCDINITESQKSVSLPTLVSPSTKSKLIVDSNLDSLHQSQNVQTDKSESKVELDRVPILQDSPVTTKETVPKQRVLFSTRSSQKIDLEQFSGKNATASNTATSVVTSKVTSVPVKRYSLRLGAESKGKFISVEPESVQTESSEDTLSKKEEETKGSKKEETQTSVKATRRSKNTTEVNAAKAEVNVDIKRSAKTVKNKEDSEEHVAESDKQVDITAAEETRSRKQKVEDVQTGVTTRRSKSHVIEEPEMHNSTESTKSVDPVESYSATDTKAKLIKSDDPLPVVVLQAGIVTRRLKVAESEIRPTENEKVTETESKQKTSKIEDMPVVVLQTGVTTRRSKVQEVETHVTESEKSGDTAESTAESKQKIAKMEELPVVVLQPGVTTRRSKVQEVETHVTESEKSESSAGNKSKMPKIDEMQAGVTTRRSKVHEPETVTTESEKSTASESSSETKPKVSKTEDMPTGVTTRRSKVHEPEVTESEKSAHAESTAESKPKVSTMTRRSKVHESDTHLSEKEKSENAESISVSKPKIPKIEESPTVVLSGVTTRRSRVHESESHSADAEKLIDAEESTGESKAKIPKIDDMPQVGVATRRSKMQITDESESKNLEKEKTVDTLEITPETKVKAQKNEDQPTGVTTRRSKTHVAEESETQSVESQKTDNSETAVSVDVKPKKGEDAAPGITTRRSKHSELKPNIESIVSATPNMQVMIEKLPDIIETRSETSTKNTTSVAEVSTETVEKTVESKTKNEKVQKSEDTLSGVSTRSKGTVAEDPKETDQNVSVTESPKATNESEKARVTRSNAGSATVQKKFQAPPITKSTLFKRRPDTPMPNYHTIRPVTRSLSNSSLTDNESSLGSDKEKKSERTLDNGFLVPTNYIRKSRSTTYVKMSERLSSLDKKVPVSNEILTNKGLAKRRPDTPMPTAEQLSRVVKPDIGGSLLFARPKPKTLAAPAVNSATPPKDVTDTDSNGNSFSASESSSLDGETSHGKTQRTAKVAAILSLDSKTSQSGKNVKSTENCTKADSPAISQANKSAVKSLARTNCKSAVIAMVDLDNEPDFSSVEATQKSNKRAKKRSRVAPLTKPLIGCKPGEMIDIEDEEVQTPTKRPTRFQPPPPQPPPGGAAEKTSNNNATT